MVPFEQGRRRDLEEQLRGQPARRLELVEDLLKVMPAASANGVSS